MALTIYERMGGFATVRRVVSDYYVKVLDSDLIAHHFERTEMPRLIEHQTRFISFLMDGPASYTDEHLQHVHARLAVTLPEFDEMVELLTETLEDHDYSAEDVAKVTRELRKREPVIVSGR